MWMAPDGRFSGRLIWKDGCLNSGGLSLSSSTEHSTVAVADRGREPLSRAWTADENYNNLQSSFYSASIFCELFKINTEKKYLASQQTKQTP